MSSKKLTLEERLSLAAKKGKKKTKKGLSTASSPEPATSDANDEQLDSKDVPSSSDAEPAETKEPATAHDIEEWLPAGYEHLPARELLEILQPHIRKLVQQSKEVVQETPKPTSPSAGGDSSLTKLLVQKDNLISQLREEGEKLSKVELRQSEQIKSLKTKLAESNYQIESLSNDLTKKDNMHMEQLQHNNKMQEQLQRAETRTKQFEEVSKKLDDVLIELEGKNLQIDKLSEDLETSKIVLESERKSFNTTLESLKKSSHQQVTMLESQVEQYRIRVDALMNTINDHNKDSATDTENRLPSHMKNQYELVKEQLEASKKNWSSIEYALNKRIADLETQLTELKKENTALSAKADTLSKIQRDAERKSDELNDLYKDKETEAKLLSDQVKNLSTVLKDLKEDYKLLQNKYNMQRTQLEQRIEPQSPLLQKTSSRRSISLGIGSIAEDDWMLGTEEDSFLSAATAKQQQLNDDDPLLYRSTSKTHFVDTNNRSTSFTTMDVDDRNSVKAGQEPKYGTFENTDIPGEAADLEVKSGSKRNSISASYSNIRLPSTDLTTPNQGGAQVINRLGAELRRLEGELHSTKQLCERLQNEREKTNDEVLRLLEENEKAKQLTKTNNELTTKIEALQKQLDASLQLLGEKTEQVEELQNDVSDLKDMMREQVQQIVRIQEETK